VDLANRKYSYIQPKPEPPNSNVIYSCAYSTDGNFLFVVISDILVVYNAETGDVITKPTKAAKEPINCVAFAKDGKTFATAS
jgi:WD40 repeat protein